MKYKDKIMINILYVIFDLIKLSIYTNNLGVLILKNNYNINFIKILLKCKDWIEKHK